VPSISNRWRSATNKQRCGPISSVSSGRRGSRDVSAHVAALAVGDAMASDPFFTDDENTCEDVVFRSRRIVYPLDLASLTPYDAHRDALVAAAAGSTAAAAAAAADGGDDIDESLVTLRALDVRDHRRLVVEDSLYDKVSDFAPPPVPQVPLLTLTRDRPKPDVSTCSPGREEGNPRENATRFLSSKNTPLAETAK